MATTVRQAIAEVNRNYSRPPSFWPTMVMPIAYAVAYITMRWINGGRPCFLPPAISIDDYELHHFVPGIGLVLLAGYLYISGWSTFPPIAGRRFPVAAIIFGIGTGLIVDETTLLFTLDKCSYNSDANIVAGVLVFGLFLTHVIRNVALYWGAAKACTNALLGRA